jgi:enoyl-CoA hydratase/carnithine racemase
MLSALQQDGRLQKVSTSDVLMTPTVNAAVPLDQLNVLIAEQKNCAVDELCNFVSGAQANAQAKKAQEDKKNSAPTTEAVSAPVRAQAAPDAVLTDTDIAKSYRSQADSMYKEAARLRKEADALAERLSKLAPITQKASKLIMARIIANQLPDCEDLIRETYGSADFKNGVASFLRGEPPIWTGK